MSELLCVRDTICELQQGSKYTSEQQTAQEVQQVTVDSVVKATEQEKLQKETDMMQLALQKLTAQKQNFVTSTQQSDSVTPHTNTPLSYDPQQNTNLNWHSASTQLCRQGIESSRYPDRQVNLGKRINSPSQV